MTLHPYVNLGIAVDLDQQGLVVPVVRDADRLNMRGIAQGITEMAAAARGQEAARWPTCRARRSRSPTPARSPATPRRRSSTSPTSASCAPTGSSGGRWPSATRSPSTRPAIIGLVYDHRAFDGSTASLFLMHIRDSPGEARLGGGGRLTGPDDGPGAAATRRRRSGDPVTVTVARRVAPGREDEFEEWSAELTRPRRRASPASSAPGCCGPATSASRGTSCSASTPPRTCDAWERSPARAEHLDARRASSCTPRDVHRVSGLETWFALPGRTAPAPPRWKMFLVSLVAIYTLQLVFNLLVAPFELAVPLRVGLVDGGCDFPHDVAGDALGGPSVAGLALRATPPRRIVIAAAGGRCRGDDDVRGEETSCRRMCWFPERPSASPRSRRCCVPRTAPSSRSTTSRTSRRRARRPARTPSTPTSRCPPTSPSQGSTALERLHHFYAKGVLARFPAMNAVVPSLKPGGRVTVVAWPLPAEVATDDDIEARRALFRVLAPRRPGRRRRRPRGPGARVEHVGRGHRGRCAGPRAGASRHRRVALGGVVRRLAGRAARPGLRRVLTSVRHTHRPVTASRQRSRSGRTTLCGPPGTPGGPSGFPRPALPLGRSSWPTTTRHGRIPPVPRPGR